VVLEALLLAELLVVLDVLSDVVVVPAHGSAGLVLLAAVVVTVESDPDVPPQAASAIVRLLSNTDQASRPPPKLRLASFMRPLEKDFVTGGTGRSHSIQRDAQRHSKANS